MTVAGARTLTVSLVELTGRAEAGVRIAVAMARPRLVVAGDPPSTILPGTFEETTGTDGVVEFQLLPSAIVGGPYVVQIGGFSRTIEMPDADARLSQLEEDAS